MLPSNMVLIAQDIFVDSLSLHRYYLSITDADITGDARRILNRSVREYLDRYFRGWRLMRRVDQKVEKIQPERQYKEVCYVIALDTDADAETFKSRLLKDGMQLPGLAALRGL